MPAETDGWKFKTEQLGRWIWQRISPGGDVVLKSGADFPSIEECAVDAQSRGYPGILGAYASMD